MKIQGFSYGGNGLPKINDTRAKRTQQEQPGKRDSVQLSKSTYSGTVDSSKLTGEPEFPVRTDIVKGIRERIREGTYNTAEVLEKTAEKILDSGAINDVTSDIAISRQETKSARKEKVDSANDQASQKYYDQPSVMKQVAGKIIDTLGFSTLA